MLAARDAVEEQRQVADLASVMQRKIETMPETQGRAKWGSSLFQKVQDEKDPSLAGVKNSRPGVAKKERGSRKREGKAKKAKR